MERRFITSREAQRQQDGGTSIAPGIWEDVYGDVHFSIPDLLRVVKLDDTAENREAVVQMVEEILGATRGPRVIRQDVQDG